MMEYYLECGDGRLVEFGLNELGEILHFEINRANMYNAYLPERLNHPAWKKILAQIVVENEIVIPDYFICANTEYLH